jgi:hypothetical protein
MRNSDITFSREKCSAPTGKLCMHANYLAPFKRTLIFISTKKEVQINESNIACCSITLFTHLLEL